MDLGTRWDDQRKLFVCDRTERSDLPPHGTLIAVAGKLTRWVAPANWHARLDQKTARLTGMFYHEVA